MIKIRLSVIVTLALAIISFSNLLSQTNAVMSPGEDPALSVPHGITFISHGFTQEGLPEAILPDPISGWMMNMAVAIKDRLGQRAIIGVYDKRSGKYHVSGTAEPIGEPVKNELILLFDWKTDTAVNAHGFSGAAADAAFASLMQFRNLPHFQNLHLIGHSRGSVVVSEIAKRMLFWGYEVDHVTYLDPHDWGAGGLLSICDDLDLNHGLEVEALPGSPNQSFPLTGVIGWDGITFADTYWQDESYHPKHNPLKGRPVSGTYNEKKAYASHTNIHAKYIETIREIATPWGYCYSRRGDIGFRTRPQIFSSKPSVQHVAARPPDIYNGCFSLPRLHSKDAGLDTDFPGWSHHGGSAKKIQRDPNLYYKLANFSNNQSITHNRLFIPETVERIYFSYKVEDANPQGQLQIMFNDDNAPVRSWNIDKVSTNWIGTHVEIPTRLRGSVATFTVKISNVQGRTSVGVDNFSFSPPAPDPSQATHQNIIHVQGGSFMMGSDEGNSPYYPSHRVSVSSYLIGKYEVTQAEWMQVMRNYPNRWSQSSHKGIVKWNYPDGPNLPIIAVSWYEAIEYCNRRSIKEGLTPVYSISGSTNPSQWGRLPTSSNSAWDAVKCDWSADGYRLPTEKEWEFAARGGVKAINTKYSGSNNFDLVGWDLRVYKEGVQPVGGKKPNELNIYDMSGNAFEWCWDQIYKYPGAQAEFYIESSRDRIKRGGGISYGSHGDDQTVYRRDYQDPSTAAEDNGFRVVRSKR